MENLETTKATLSTLSATNLGEAIKNLQSLLPGAAPKKKDILMLLGNLETLNQERRNDTLGFDELNTGMNRIRRNFLDLVGSLQESDFAETATAPAEQVKAVPKFMFVYDAEDEDYATKLNKHLFLYQRNGKLAIYNVIKGVAGDPIEEAKKQLAETDYIICFFTINLLVGSWLDFIWDSLKAGKRVIPVRIADISLDESGLEKYRSLPSQNRTISAFKTEDAAYADIAAEIVRLLPR
ncbi:MAG: hypothetical protein IT262_23330 [Saprospiraceae bacterium]|nr:hypothetical protein [Saprospiraceae bacterium]